MYLEKINGPEDVKKIKIDELPVLAQEIRDALLVRASKHGGHFGPNFGMVEATIAMHYVFESPKDKIVYDVSHQSYPHKMLTGRKDAYLYEEHYDDVSGYTNPKESEHDMFNVGHTSTSISLAAGLAKARDLKGENNTVVAVIGDGSLTGGMAYEALNNAAELKTNFIIVLNDNNMSISKNVGGMSSSLPEDVQLAMYRTVPGLEHCRMVRNAYAIEYDCINPNQLYPSLGFKAVEGLYSGGQFNGSSGYEEAAVQGFVAGVNAARYILKKDPLILDRSEAYIGVLIDDLVTKENREPYRMMTSRAEYRLLLRQDNADLRLREKGYEIGLITEEQYRALLMKKSLIEQEINRLKNVLIGASRKNQEFFESHNSATLKTGVSLAELMCRPELSYEILAEIDPERKELPADVIEQVEIEIKYEGYIERQLRQVEQFKKMEEKKIPENINYDEIQSLRIEAKQKLNLYRPINIGQASRISGVSPADISVLLIWLSAHNEGK